MVKTAVYNQTGEKVSELDLNPQIFGLEKIDPHLVHAAVRTQRNNNRKATAHTKNRGEVSGSGKKPWKQKGTGRARAGSIRSPLWRGGGITFGPRSERNYSLRFNRRAWRKALFTILTDRVKEGKFAILENLEAEKTSELSKKLKSFSEKSGLGKKFAIIIARPDKKLERAARNLPQAKLLVANRLNILDLLNHTPIVLKDALEVIEQTYLKE